MPTNKFIVSLEESEREQLKQILKTGTSARVIRRAHTLLMADNNRKTDVEISQWFYLHEDTIANIRRRYREEGLERALYDEPRPGQPYATTAEDEAYLIALACTNPPEGYDRWTLNLLTRQTEKDGRKLTRSTIYNVLLRNELKPWREKNVVHSTD